MWILILFVKIRVHSWFNRLFSDNCRVIAFTCSVKFVEGSEVLTEKDIQWFRLTCRLANYGDTLLNSTTRAGMHIDLAGIK